ncbi:TPA: acyl carrier protein [Klebsiella variicola subsp. variicola]
MKHINKSDIELCVRGIITSQFGNDSGNISGNSALADTIQDYSSLSSLNLINKIEDEFNLEVDFVSDDIRYSFANINNIVNYIKERLEDNLD